MHNYFRMVVVGGSFATMIIFGGGDLARNQRLPRPSRNPIPLRPTNLRDQARCSGVMGGHMLQGGSLARLANVDSAENILSVTSADESEFECPVCFNTSVACKECGQKICVECFKKLDKCPLCRESFNKIGDQSASVTPQEEEATDEPSQQEIEAVQQLRMQESAEVQIVQLVPPPSQEMVADRQTPRQVVVVFNCHKCFPELVCAAGSVTCGTGCCIGNSIATTVGLFMCFVGGGWRGVLEIC